MSLAAVGFDLDDTLCVPVRDRATLLHEAAATVDAAPLDREEYLAAHRRHLTGRTRAPIFAELLEDPDAEAPSTLARAYRERVNEAIQPVDGVVDLLAKLGETYAVGLLTNGPALAQRGKLETLGLAEAFDAVLISGELPAGKPDPHAFEALLEGLGVSPEELVYVGDDVDADVGGATVAGCRAIQVIHEDGADPDARAIAHVPVDVLATELPAAIAAANAES